MELTKPYQECPSFEERTVNCPPLHLKADGGSEGSDLTLEGWEIFECWAKERHRIGLGATRFRQRELDEICGTLCAMRRISRSTGANDGKYWDWFG